MRLILDSPEVVSRYVGAALGCEFAQPFTAIGVENDHGDMRGGLIFNGFDGNAIEMTVAGAACLTRNVMAAVVAYVFEQCRCVRLQLHTRLSNERVIATAERLGFTREGISRRLFDSEDGVCFSLTIDDVPGFRARWRL